MKERDFLDVDEFCVDKEFRRQGIASELVQHFLIDYTF